MSFRDIKNSLGQTFEVRQTFEVYVKLANMAKNTMDYSEAIFSVIRM